MTGGFLRKSSRAALPLHAFRRSAAALLLVAVCIGGAGSVAASRARDTSRHVAGRPYRAGVVVVGLAPGTPAAARRRLERIAGAKRSSTLSSDIEILEVGAGRVVDAIGALRGRPQVRYVEPDYVQTESAVPGDSSFGLQWGFANTGQTVNGVTGIAGADEHAVPAWDVTTGSRSVVIAEVDSGIDYTHPDLAANIWSNPGGIGGCPAGTHGYNVIAKTCDPMDDEVPYGGHGTHVAGILGAVGNNGAGVTGVNWRTSIAAVKWLNSAGSGSTSSLIAALEWVLKAKRAGVNIRVVNDSATFVGTAPSQALSHEIDVLGRNGILFVTAAGNTGENNDEPADRRYPCGYHRLSEICVTASNQRDELPSWANYGGSTVDLAAPGDNVYSTLRGGRYGTISGGSMASPQVAGAAALILSRTSMPPRTLKADILGNVDPVPELGGRVRTGGRLDICKALPGCATPSALGTASVGPRVAVITANRKQVNPYRLSAAAVLPGLNIYLQPTRKRGQQVLRGVVYADSGGSPRALVATTGPFRFRGRSHRGWYYLPFSSPPTLQPGAYWIGIISGPKTRVAALRWRSVARSRSSNVNPYRSGPSNPFGVSSVGNELISVYATLRPLVAAVARSRGAAASGR